MSVYNIITIYIYIYIYGYFFVVYGLVKNNYFYFAIFASIVLFVVLYNKLKALYYILYNICYSCDCLIAMFVIKCFSLITTLHVVEFLKKKLVIFKKGSILCKKDVQSILIEILFF